VELLNLTLILLIFLLPFFVLYLFIRNVFSKLFIGLSCGYAIVAIALLFTQFSTLQAILVKEGDGPSDTKRIGIESFQNLTGTDSLDFLVNAIQSSIMMELGKNEAIDLVYLADQSKKSSYASILSLSSKEKFDALLEGSVSGKEDSIVFQVKLTSEGNEMWNNTYSRPTRNILQLYVDVSADINTVFDRSSPRVERIAPPVNERAYLMYWKGRNYLDNLTPKDMTLAIRHFEKALDIDSNYAEAWSGIAMAWGFRRQMNLISFDELLQNAMDPMNKALEISADHPEVQHAKGVVTGWYLWNWEDSNDGLARSIELNPNYASGYADYSHILATAGKVDQALDYNIKALELEPFNSRFLSFYAMTLNNSRQYEKAIETMTDPEGELVENGLTYSTLRTTYHLLGDFEMAGKMWIESYKSRKDTLVVDLLESTISQGGYFQALDSLAELMITRKEGGSLIPAWNIATMKIRAQQFEESLVWLNTAYEEHSPNMPYLNIDPIFDPIREDPKYTELIRKLGL